MKPRRVSLQQLSQFAQAATSAEQRLQQSALFLHGEAISRMNDATNTLLSSQEQLGRTQGKILLPPVLDNLVEEYRASSRKIQNEAPRDNSTIEKFSLEIADAEARLAEKMTSVARGLEGWVKDNNSTDSELQIINVMLQRLHFSWISLRVMLGEHNAVFASYNAEQGGKPAKQRQSLVNAKCNVAEIINAAAEDARSQFVEKTGDCPPFLVKGALDTTMVPNQLNQIFI